MTLDSPTDISRWEKFYNFRTNRGFKMSVTCSYPTRRVTLPWLLRDINRSSQVRHATRISNATDARKTTTQSTKTTFYKATKISLVYSL